ncbi:MAG: class I SAM-dependent DNA methyltransferase, partial [Rugosibacter sp.]|nr:class I SAM-dependent DNA methyltransferase [Rugosibacter sp.]
MDAFWPGILLVEMKSRGKNLERAYSQAMDYFPGIKERDLPRYVLVCDFGRFRLHDLKEGSTSEFALADFYKNVRLFGFIAGYQTQVIQPQDPINIRAAEHMGRLHDKMKAVGYVGRPLEIYLVRLLFCLFAEDTGICEKRQFQDYLEQRTAEDGSDLADRIATLFHILNTPNDKRLSNLDEQLAAFPYINGKLFEETLPPAGFDAAMREALLDLCGLDWSLISPAIFGSLFQSIMDDTARRNLGAHYTSEENIQKLIKPLFLDELRAEFEKIKKNRNKLFDFHKKLRTLRFFDPACGCGNFLAITYRELRLLELDVLRAAHIDGQQMLDIHQLVAVDVDQFYGIEIEEFPAQIAQVALWLVDHQMNIKVSEEFGSYFVRIPLKHAATIVHGNALQLDWNAVLPAPTCAYVLGNPPFVGKSYQNAEQKADMAAVMHDVNGAGVLDFVAAWYVKAARYMAAQSAIRAAFVSTNSITQGEQVGVLWGWLLAHGVKIHFAHRTFSWSNEARGKAAVHCVIIGFGLQDVAEKTIFEYEDIRGEAHAIKAANINPYLVDAPDVVLPGRTNPVCAIPMVVFGSKPTDGGNLILTEEEKRQLLNNEPMAEKFVRTYLSADEFLNGNVRYCLWLKDCQPNELQKFPHVLQHIERVRQFRLASTKTATRDNALMPMLFAEDRQPISRYLAIPKTSSERRHWIPIAFLEAEVIVASELFTVQGAGLFHFGILT